MVFRMPTQEEIQSEYHHNQGTKAYKRKGAYSTDIWQTLEQFHFGRQFVGHGYTLSKVEYGEDHLWYIFVQAERRRLRK